MDTAVSLVEAYLYANGYFTVCEYPVMETLPNGHVRSATDVDILAVRFPGAGRYVPDANAPFGGRIRKPDHALRVGDQSIDMIIGEVKEGEAALNRGTRDPDVLKVALRRFGQCAAEHAENVVDQLLEDGVAHCPDGTRVRLFGFGSRRPHQHGGFEIITLGHIIDHLADLVADRHRSGSSESKHPALEFIALMNKAGRM